MGEMGSVGAADGPKVAQQGRDRAPNPGAGLVWDWYIDLVPIRYGSDRDRRGHGG